MLYIKEEGKIPVVASSLSIQHETPSGIASCEKKEGWRSDHTEIGYVQARDNFSMELMGTMQK